MKTYTQLVADVLPQIRELFPWDVEEKLKENEDLLIVDIREPYEFEVVRIEHSINVPRGVLESACDWGYEETVPRLAAARDKEVVLVCRSGNRSALAAHTMQLMGYQQVYSMKTGLAGWNDYELPLVDNQCQRISVEVGDAYFETKVRPEQMPPK